MQEKVENYSINLDKILSGAFAPLNYANLLGRWKILTYGVLSYPRLSTRRISIRRITGRERVMEYGYG